MMLYLMYLVITKVYYICLIKEILKYETKKESRIRFPTKLPLWKTYYGCWCIE